MEIELRAREKWHVRVFWERSQDPEIKKFFPSGTESLQEDATSYGRVIYYKGRYVGDIWCYCIQDKTAMLSIVIFEKECWGQGIAAVVTRMFLHEIFAKYGLDRIGAFTYSANTRVIGLLEKVGFMEIDTFIEDGLKSNYFEIKRNATFPQKWRETIDPFGLKFHVFSLEAVLGYPHAGNDVFHVVGKFVGRKVKAFLKVERQKTADIEREVLIIGRLNFPFVPTILEYSLDAPRFILTEEAGGQRLSQILSDNAVIDSLSYLI